MSIWRGEKKLEKSKGGTKLKDRKVRYIKTIEEFRELILDNYIIKILWSLIDKKENNECWKWLGTVDRNGYGVFNIKNKTIGAHRLLYVLVNGEIPKGERNMP